MSALSPEAIEYGDMTMATDADSGSNQEYWFRGAWFDPLGICWKDLDTLATRRLKVRPCWMR